MIQYIVAAGLGALIGSAQKGKKKYKKGGSVMKKDPATKREILRESDGIMDDADDLIRIADKKRLDRDDKMGIQTLADEMKFRAGNIYDTAQKKLAKGGKTEISREEVVEALRDPIEEMMDDVAQTYEFFGSEVNVEEIEHESRDGFIPFTDGGIVAQFFGLASTYIGSGISMPTNTLQAELERLEDKAYEYADENTEDEEEERWELIDEYLSDASIMFSCEAQYYAPDNDRGEDGKHTITLAGVVNMEGPYHRRGKMEDFKEITFTFSSIQDLEKKLESNLEKIKAWFDGDEFEKGRKLKFAKGGNVSSEQKMRHKHVEKVAERSINKMDSDDQRSSLREYAQHDIGQKFLERDKALKKAYEDKATFDLPTPRYYTSEFAHGGKTQGYNARLDESLAMRRGSKRTKKQGYKARRHESEGMERSMGRRKYASVGTMDKGRRKMAKGGTIVGAGKSGLDKIKKTSKENPSQMYMVTDDNYTNIGRFYLKNGKFAKKTVANADYDFFHNKVSLRPKSDVIYKAIEIEGKGGYYAKGGKTQGYNARLDESLSMRHGAGRKKEQGRKDRRDESEAMERSMRRRKYASVDTMDMGNRMMAHGGAVEVSRRAREIGSLTGVRANAIQNFVDQNNLDIERLLRFVQKGTLTDRMDLMTAIVGNPNNKVQKRIIKDFQMAHGGKTQGYNARLDESLSMRHGAGRKKEQGRKDRRDESEAMERSMRRRKYASVDTMDMGNRMMAHGGKTHRQGYDDKLDESLAMRRGAGRTKEQGRKDRRDESAGMERSMGRRKYASVGTMDKGRRKMEDGGMVEYLLYGVAEGKPDYMEEILFVDDKPIRITEKLRDMASAKGFDRLRTSMVDLKIAPDFTKALNFKKGGKTKGRKKVSDFDKLAMKVAARYRAQGMSNEKAMEIGRGTAGKVARQQQAKKRKK